MADTSFFPRPEPLSLGEIAALAEATTPEGVNLDRRVLGVAPLDGAGPDDLAYMDGPRYADALATTRAGACLVTRRFAGRVPTGSVALVTARPHHGFAKVLARLYPTALRPGSLFGATGVSPGAMVHPTARLERGVAVDPGAVIGPGAEIGSGTVIGPGAVIGPKVRVGRDCSIGPNASVTYALLGNRVIVHGGARIGQDGFGYALGPMGHVKVPQVGRVIVQDDVEVGANSTIDRGASRDTVIGEGTKIDNLVQIGHNCVIGRHCVIVGQVGISGSTVLEDFVVMAGKASTTGHLRIGAGAQIAGDSNVKDDVPPGARYGGSPAKPIREWFREMAVLKRLASRRDLAKDGEAEPEGG